LGLQRNKRLNAAMHEVDRKHQGRARGPAMSSTSAVHANWACKPLIRTLLVIHCGVCPQVACWRQDPSTSPATQATAEPRRPVEQPQRRSRPTRSSDPHTSCESNTAGLVGATWKLNQPYGPTLSFRLQVLCGDEPTPPRVDVTVSCAPTLRSTMTADLQRLIQGGGTSIPDIGLAAVLLPQGTSSRIVAWDDDTDCRIDLLAPAGLDPVAHAKHVVARIPN
jgi:hypothetical protein